MGSALSAGKRPEQSPMTHLHTFLRRPWLALLALLLLVLLTSGAVWVLALRGTDQLQRAPAPGAEAISTLSDVSVRFPELMDESVVPALSFTPAVSGTVHWQANTLHFEPARPLQSATTYTITLSDMQTAAGEALPAQSWHFRTAPLHVLYVGWDAQQRPQLYRASLGGDDPRPLTDNELGIEGYTLSPDGSTIVYSARRADGGADLWRVTRDGDDARRLLACPDAECGNVAWHPDGRRLVYVRRELLPAEEEATERPRLWWLLLEREETVPVFADEEQGGTLPRFSASGRWLAYVSPGERAILAYDLESEASVLIPSETGEAPMWHPQQPELLSTEILFPGERFSVHIYRVAVPSANTIDLSGDLETNDSAPAWSPDGKQIAFTRKVPRAPIGKQIWLMQANGSEQRPLTSDPQSNFSNPTWSPDGTLLLAQHFRISEPSARPAIWHLDATSGESTVVAPSGILPRWLP